MTPQARKVVFVSSLGTVFEWYNFYLYGSLIDVLARQFFSELSASAAFIAALMAFSAGFFMRPFGAIVFGRLGDLIGRKQTFLVTILVMGLSSFAIGVLPGYGSIGVGAPVLLVSLFMLQGLALGGEYGGATTFLAEHVPPGKRAACTAWLQTTATLGLLLSLLVVLGARAALSGQAFADWGWRIPFWVSLLLLGVSVWARLNLDESPAFLRIKAAGRTSAEPLAESFGRWKNLRVVILALLGLTAGQAVIWYTGQFYALFFLIAQLKVEARTANLMVAAALLLGAPFFVAFGTLADRIGRKPIIMAGCLLAVLTYFPVFKLLTEAANPQLARAQATAAVTVTADAATCSFQGNPVAREIDFRSSCDIAKRYLVQNSVNYENLAGAYGSPARVTVGGQTVTAPAGRVVNQKFDEASVRAIAAFKQELGDALRVAGYPARADPARMHRGLMVLLLAYLVVLVAMVYGPIAAMLVELFPTRIRYTCVSLPYHIGNGWFGGLLPTTAFAIVASTGNIYSGLWYPIIIAGMTLVVGTLCIRETRGVDIYADD